MSLAPKGEEDLASGPVTRPAPEAAPPESNPGVADYPWLCCSCQRMVMLSPADAVVAEARAVIGNLTIVFCGGCVAGMVDGA